MSDDVSSLEIWEIESQQVLKDSSEEVFAKSFHCMLLLSFCMKAILLCSALSNKQRTAQMNPSITPVLYLSLSIAIEIAIQWSKPQIFSSSVYQKKKESIYLSSSMPAPNKSILQDVESTRTLQVQIQK